MFTEKHSFIYRCTFPFKCFIWLFIFGFSIAGFSQSYNFKEISIQQGLPQSQAFDIAFDKHDYAWIATQGGGLCRFDGEEFDYFTKKDSLISNRVYSIYIQDNDLWVGQKGGLTHYTIHGDHIANYRFTNDEVVVQDLTMHDSLVYLATSGGIFYVEGDQLNAYDSNPNVTNVNCFSFFEPNDNSFWVCTNEGLLNLNDAFQKINEARGLKSHYLNCALEFNNYWVLGTYGQGIALFDFARNKVLFPDLFDNQIILSLAKKSENEIWIGTMNNGLYSYNLVNQSIKNFRSTNGLSSNNIKVIQRDTWGNVWIGTSGGGISIYKNSPFITFNSISGLNSDYVFSSCYDSKNNLWVGTDASGIMRLNDTSVFYFDGETGFYDEKVKAIHEDARGYVWIGTEGKGLAVYSPLDGKDTLYLFGAEKGLSANWVRSFTEDNRGNIYIGTRDNGIYRVNKGVDFPLTASFRKMRFNGVDIPDKITHVHWANGKLWFANPSGVFGFIGEDQAIVQGAKSGTLRNILTKDNHVWIGTADEGVLHYVLRNDSLISFRSLNTENDLMSNNVYQLLGDGDNIWVGTEKGLQRLELDSAYKIKSTEVFDFDDGFEGLETNTNACQKDAQGNLWFGTVKGLYQYIGGTKDSAQNNPPSLRINDVQIFYESIDSSVYAKYFKNGAFTEYLHLPYDQNHIGFSFSAIHYANPEKVRFSWYLEGADKRWTPATKSTSATYSNLAPGDYTFRLKSSITDAFEDEEELTLAFSIDNPFWEETWFKALYVSGIVLVFLIIVLIIWVRIRQKNRRLKEKFKLEKEMIELEQKALRLQMNPHFIFNVLNTIHNQIILNDSDKARYALAKFSKLMRRILENSREKFISIDDEVETIENYVQLEKLTNDISFEFEIDIDEEIDTTEEILPPMLLQPFIENSIIHGIKELGEKGKIKVVFALLNEHLLECRIIDNGKGREAAAVANAQKESYHKSAALNVTQERLNNLNADLGYKSFEIIDKKDDQGKAAGTEVVLRVSI